jgi:hypothetical protein
LTVETIDLYGFQHFIRKSSDTVETMIALNNDQRREAINTRQRFDAWTRAKQRLDGYQGSMLWGRSKGTSYLRRSYYDERSGLRRQTSLGPRSATTEKLLADFKQGRNEAKARFADIDSTLARQASINRAIGLGRVPVTGAKILRGLQDAKLLGNGLRVVGTNALYAYEAAAGVIFESDITTTEDIDLLLNARSTIRIAIPASISERSLLAVLKNIDRSFERTGSQFRAANAEGYLVDLIKPQARPPWRDEPSAIGEEPDDLQATMIEGLVWLESSPAFSAVAIDHDGWPVPIVTIDPRAFAAHKLWMSTLPGRDPLKRHRDAAQARAVAGLVVQHLPHLPYEAGAMQMLPREVFRGAKPLFAAKAPRP